MKKLLSLILSLAVIFVGIIPVSMVSASAGTDATLIDICFENHSVFGFDSNTFIYQNVEQPYRFSTTGDNYPRPVVSATPKDPNATVDITVNANADKANYWDIIIKVTAADGVTKQHYNLYTKPIGQNMYKSGGNTMDPNFESGTATGWRGGNTADTFSVTNATVYTGDYSLEYVPADANSFPIPIPKDSEGNGNFGMSSGSTVTWFSSYAVKSDVSVHEKNGASGLNPTYIFVDDNGNTLKTQADTSAAGRTDGALTAKDAVTGWQRSMRISKSVSGTQPLFQGAAASWSANKSNKVYFDEFYMGALVISEIQVSGDTYVKLGETSTLNYSAKLLNQYGNEGGLKGELTGGTKETVTWKLVNAPEDVTIDKNTGVVTVPNTVTETGDFYVEAQVENSTFNTPSEAGVYKEYCQTQMGGRIKVSLLPENAEAALADITVNGGGIEGFAPDVTAYDIYVPYSASDFEFVRPVIEATPVMEGAKVVVGDIPNPITNGAKITITAYDKSEILSKTYTLTINTVGENLFKDGGFEGVVSEVYQMGNNGPLSWEIVDNSTGTGNKVLKANGGRDGNWYSAALRTVNNYTYLAPGKTYINGFMVKLDDAIAEHTEKSFVAGVVAGHDDSVKKREQFAGDYYKLSTGENVAKTLTLTESWEKYAAVVSSTRDANVRVGVSMGSNTHKARSYFLYDNMYIGELVIADVALTNANGQTAAEARQGEEVELTVAAKNQYGNTQGITSDVEYEVINGYQGLTFDGNTVKVAADAAAGTAVIEATVTPTYAGADSNYYVKQRFTLTILPGDGFTYSKNTISAGDVVTTLNYTAQENVNLMFVNALYEVVNGALVFRNCITDNAISLTAGQRVSKDLTLTVPQTGTYCIKSYLFEKETLKPIFDTIGSLGQ